MESIRELRTWAPASGPLRSTARLALLALAAAMASMGQSASEGTAAVGAAERFLRLQDQCLAGSACALSQALPTPGVTGSGDIKIETVAVPNASSLQVYNGASFSTAITAGAWISIRGLDLAGVTRLWGPSDFNGDILPIALSGTSVRIGTRDAAIYYVSPTQINALIPPDAPAGQATLTVTSPVGAAASTTVTLAPFAPGVFMFAPQNGLYVAAVLPDGTLAGKVGLFSDSPNLTRPLKAGGRVSLYATGLGTTNPEIPPGRNFTDPRPMNGIEWFHCTIGGQPATVEYAGAVSPGLYQINIVAPVLATGDYPVVLDYGGFPSRTGAMITIQGDPSLSHLTASPNPVVMLAYTTSSSPATQSLQLLSTGEDFPFTLQSSAAWLTFDAQSGRTPATVQVSADARSLAPGTYNQQITVLAPGTASPSTTIPVTVTVSNTPQITVSRSSISYQLVAGYYSGSVLINVLSDSGNVDFTVTKTGDTWLSVPATGRTPGAILITMSSGSLPAGVLTGSVRITPAGGGTPRDIAVSLTIVANAASGGPPQIVWLGEDEMLWGRKGSFTVYGQNLDGASTVTVSPSQGITVDTVSPSTGYVTMNLAIAATAAEGTRTITVTTPRGTSNAFPFTVRQGHPQIRDLTPAVVNPGRFYGAVNGSYGNPGSSAFGLAGVDLQGLTGQFAIDPPDGVQDLWAIAVNQPVAIWGVAAIDPSAQPGVRHLSIVTAGGQSNALTFEVRPASPNAPVISNLTVSAYTYAYSGAYVNYSGTIDFTDADGDITTGSKVFLMPDTGSGLDYQWLVTNTGSTYLDQKGKTSGTIKFSFSFYFMMFYRTMTGKIPIRCMIQDAAGNLSNTAVTTVSYWAIPVL